MLGLDIDSQSEIIKSINKHLILILGIFIVLFVIAQFTILATVGVKGAEITRIRAEQQMLRVENQALTSDIDAAKVLENIEPEVRATFELSRKNVETIRPSSYADDRVVGTLP